jgi:hypothetical protein
VLVNVTVHVDLGRNHFSGKPTNRPIETASSKREPPRYFREGKLPTIATLAVDALDAFSRGAIALTVLAG